MPSFCASEGLNMPPLVEQLINGASPSTEFDLSASSRTIHMPKTHQLSERTESLPCVVLSLMASTPACFSTSPHIQLYRSPRDCERISHCEVMECCFALPSSMSFWLCAPLTSLFRSTWRSESTSFELGKRLRMQEHFHFTERKGCQ